MKQTVDNKRYVLMISIHMILYCFQRSDMKLSFRRVAAGVARTVFKLWPDDYLAAWIQGCYQGIGAGGLGGRRTSPPRIKSWL